jgi:hypothetical protein
MPPLPAQAGGARPAGAETSLAVAIEAARAAIQAGSPPPAEAKPLFIASLATLIRQALGPEGGDPHFQSLVLRTQDPAVDEHVRLATHAAADRRAIRTMTDAVAHPGKLRDVAAGPMRDRLAHLHGLAAAGEWMQLRRAVDSALPHISGDDERLRSALAAIASAPALARLERASALLAEPAVRRYQALCEQRGPLAGSDAAAAQGRASARIGGVAEEGTLASFREIVGLLHAVAPLASYRAIASLRTPRGFPGAAHKAKDEWDAAIVRSRAAGGAADIVLLAEVKASPAAATPDFSRLLRGLQRLAHAGTDAVYEFPSSEGDVRVAGESLRRLRPDGASLPPQVIYCCSAPAETQPQVLSAATQAVLLAEPASLAFARQLARGESPPDDALTPIFHDVMSAPRLRSALNQYDTARRVREAMLHPHDLVEAVRQRCVTGPAGGIGRR